MFKNGSLVKLNVNGDTVRASTLQSLGIEILDNQDKLYRVFLYDSKDRVHLICPKTGYIIAKSIHIDQLKLIVGNQRSLPSWF